MYKTYEEEDVTLYSVLLVNAPEWTFFFIVLFTIIDPDFLLVNVQVDVAIYVSTLSSSMITSMLTG